MPIRQSNLNELQRRVGARAWAKNDAWKNIKGGFNPDVFKDLDPATRQKLLDYQVGPPNLKQDKDLGLSQVLTIGEWSDGRPKSATFTSDMFYGDRRPQAYNRGSVQQAVWETGLSNIGNKDQLNQFLDRADAVKAKHGDFLKDGWTPEAIMLMRRQPEQTQAVETAPAPLPAPEEPKDETVRDIPIRDSSKLAEAKERASNFTAGSVFDPTKYNPDTFDRRSEYDHERTIDGMKRYDFSST